MITYETPITDGWRVVVRYDDPRGGTWRGSVRATRTEAERDLAFEQSRVYGTAWLEMVGRPKLTA